MRPQRSRIASSRGGNGERVPRHDQRPQEERASEQLGGLEVPPLKLDEESLADAIMQVSSSTEKLLSESIRRPNQSIPILVGDVGQGFEDTDGFPRIVIMPVDQRTIGRQTIDYTGDEDLSWLAGLVLAS